MSVFQAGYAYGQEAGYVEEFTPDGSATHVPGDLVFYDTATQTMKKCGADPALIAAVSEVTSQSAKLLTANGKVPYRLLTLASVVKMPCSSAPTELNVGVAYGVVNVSGVWQVDFTDTGNTRVLVRRVVIGEDSAYVQFIAANLQFDSVVA